MKKILPYISGLHVLPWFTDGALDFIDGYIFYLKNYLGVNPTIFEYGGGGSTLYFLSRGCAVYTVDHDLEWVNKIKTIAHVLDQDKRLWISYKERPYNLSIFNCKFDEAPFDLICVDGRDRVSCLTTIVKERKFSKSILILDNTERVSNKYQKYTELLEEYNLMHFEAPFVFGSPVTQPENNNGLKLGHDMPTNGLAAGVYRDRSGNCNKGRSITTVAIPKCCQPFTSQGHPFIQNLNK